MRDFFDSLDWYINECLLNQANQTLGILTQLVA